jgi:hypothetical protein
VHDVPAGWCGWGELYIDQLNLGTGMSVQMIK